MSGLAIEISIRDTATLALRALKAGIKPARLQRPAGAAVTQLFRNHFTALNAARANQMGGTRTNFYAGAARSTSWQPVPDGLVIAVNKQGIRQRFFGGTINAKPGKALTIPADPAAYGKRAREFNNLHVAIFKGSTGNAIGALFTNAATNISIGKRGVKAKSSTIERVMYWLVKSVTQRPDPTVLPTDAAITGAALTGMRQYIAAIVARRSQP